MGGNLVLPLRRGVFLLFFVAFLVLVVVVIVVDVLVECYANLAFVV